MNYRHAFHAGNHAEVFKHAVLTLLLLRLRAKPKPFWVIDTHAGIGTYDLASVEALKTGEAEDGVKAVLGFPFVAARPYLNLVAGYVATGTYPGSPKITQEFLREGDRLTACELHPEDVGRLRSRMRGDPRVAVHARDGFEAMLALVPPVERRGLVFCDPPYENPDEAERVAQALVAAYRKWPTGIYAVWYPVKDDRIGRVLAEAAQGAGLANCLRAELIRDRIDGIRLAGSGLLLVNPPWRLDEELRAVCGELAAAFRAPEAKTVVEWISPPA